MLDLPTVQISLISLVEIKFYFTVHKMNINNILVTFLYSPPTCGWKPHNSYSLMAILFKINPMLLSDTFPFRILATVN